MAWIYLAVSVESDAPWMNMSTQSPTVKEIDTLKPSYFQEWLTNKFHALRFGMTLQLSKQTCSQKSTSFLEDFPVKTSALQDLVQAWQESEADFSTRLSGLQKKLVRRLCSLKTCQQLELEDFEKFSEHLPKSGMTVGGLVFLPQALEHTTKEIDGFYWPTPTVCGNYQNKKQGNSQLIGLATAVKMYPTPKASDWKQNGSPSEMRRNTPGLAAQVCRGSGQLNPQFVEWLMGYPLEWTALNVSVTQWFRSKSKRRLKG